jgi:hypothetical protein
VAEAYKEVTIQGRAFRVGRFSAKDGSFLALKVGGLLAPLFGGASASPAEVPMLEMLGKLTAGLQEKDFSYLQEKCLAVCEERLPAGWTKVVDASGAFAVFDLDENATLVLALTIQALVFNLSDFFGEHGLTELLGALSPTSSSS